MGVQWRTLNIPGIERLQGAGVYYGGGTSEALSCKGETVYIIGGANSAGQAAMHFSKFAKQVIMLVRGESLAATMSHYLIEQIEKTPNIDVWTQSSVTEVHGDQRLDSITVKRGSSRSRTRFRRQPVYFYWRAASHGVARRLDRAR